MANTAIRGGGSTTKAWTIGLLVLLATAACAEGESLGIEEVPEKVLALQEGLETEGFTILSTGPNGTSEGQFRPNPYRAERLIRSVAAQEGLDDWETDLLLERMKESWDRKAATPSESEPRERSPGPR